MRRAITASAIPLEQGTASARSAARQFRLPGRRHPLSAGAAGSVSGHARQAWTRRFVSCASARTYRSSGHGRAPGSDGARSRAQGLGLTVRGLRMSARPLLAWHARLRCLAPGVCGTRRRGTGSPTRRSWNGTAGDARSQAARGGRSARMLSTRTRARKVLTTSCRCPSAGTTLRRTSVLPIWDAMWLAATEWPLSNCRCSGQSATHPWRP